MIIEILTELWIFKTIKFPLQNNHRAAKLLNNLLTASFETGK